jgi:hypothetical protein
VLWNILVELRLDSVVLAVFVPGDSYFGADVAGVISILSDARILHIQEVVKNVRMQVL